MPSLARLFVTDYHASVLNLAAAGPRNSAYAPFGYCRCPGDDRPCVQFNGQYREPRVGSYLLGNGYRLFDSVLMRFNSPDSLSPFGAGGINAYAYCQADPVNGIDPSGHLNPVKVVLRGDWEMDDAALRAFGGRRTPLYAPVSDRMIGRYITTQRGLDDYIDRAIVQVNAVVSRDLGPRALAAVRELPYELTGRYRHLASRLSAQRQSPLTELIALHADGSAFDQQVAGVWLEEVFRGRYQSHLAGDRATLISAIRGRLDAGNYPDAWYPGASRSPSRMPAS